MNLKFITKLSLVKIVIGFKVKDEEFCYFFLFEVDRILINDNVSTGCIDNFDLLDTFLIFGVCALLKKQCFELVQTRKGMMKVGFTCWGPSWA